MLSSSFKASIVKRIIQSASLAICLAWLSPVAAHPGHGKAIDRNQPVDVVRHYVTEPVHVASTIAIVVFAVTCGLVVARKLKTAE